VHHVGLWAQSRKSILMLVLLLLRCIGNLANNLCPFCRKLFVSNRVKKLHVALLDSKEINKPSKATELLRRIALVSGERSSLEDVVQVVEEANTFLAENQEDQEEVRICFFIPPRRKPANPPSFASASFIFIDEQLTLSLLTLQHRSLRAAISGLRNFNQLKDKHNQEKLNHRRHKQQLVDRQKRFEVDIHTAKAVENSLLARLEEVEKECKS
jgi:hypothetical protein